MKKALRLARRAEGRTSPNPMVGSVIVKAGRVIAEGYHKMPGTPHAEAIALSNAGEKAKGATLYVTLEPCCHTNKRTPPCTNAIIASGVKHVVAAMRDPNPNVSGKGFAQLRAAGIKVTEGVYEALAMELNEAYIKFMQTGLPLVTLKAAMTLDGKIATPTGQSKWITGEQARRIVHKARSKNDAIITAIGTLLADDPSLTARIPRGRDPLRVVIDPEFRTPPSAKLLKCPPQTIIVTRSARDLDIEGVTVLRYEDKLDLHWLLRELGKRGVLSVMMEGGSSLNAHALMAGVVDKLMLFVAPKIIGGRDSYPVVGGGIALSLDKAIMLDDMKVRRVGEDVLIEGRVRKSTR